MSSFRETAAAARDYVGGMCIARLQQEQLIASQALDREPAPSDPPQDTEPVPQPVEQVLVPASSG